MRSRRWTATVLLVAFLAAAIGGLAVLAIGDRAEDADTPPPVFTTITITTAPGGGR